MERQERTSALVLPMPSDKCLRTCLTWCPPAQSIRRLFNNFKFIWQIMGNLPALKVWVFFRRFIFTFIFTAIALALQIYISLQKIAGYPDDLWSSYFISWWLYSAPFLCLGLFLVCVSDRILSHWKRLVCLVFGRLILFLFVFSHYLSLLAIG